MKATMDAVSRLAAIASDHPDMAPQINEMIAGLIRPVETKATLVNGRGRVNGKAVQLNLPRFETAKATQPDDCECEKPKLSVHDVAKLVGFDHQSVAKWCIMGRIRASKEWRKDRRGGRVRSWMIEQREVDRYLAAGLLSIDMGRNRYPLEATS